MKTKFNRWLSGFLAILMLFTCVPVNAVELDSNISSETSSESTSETSTQEVYSQEELSSSETGSQEESTSLSEESSTSESLEIISEEPEEEPVDNWNLEIFFYDSTVDNGKTPLTEINWNASDGGYKEGTSRVITVQINYKNTNTVTRYDIGDLEIRIPNLIYKTDYIAQWTSSVIVGANDSTHTEYDWDFITGDAPSVNQEYFEFTNAKKIEKKANLEGSIQIVYIITPKVETPEQYLDECIHSYSKTLQATFGKTGERPVEYYSLTNTETVITSPNFPNNYDNNLSADTTYWEYTSPTSENLMVAFSQDSFLEKSYDFVYVYDKTGARIAVFTGTEMAGKTIAVNGNYVKLAMKTDMSGQKTGFKASVGTGEVKVSIPDGFIFSNELPFNYTRTYTHPWQQRTHTITKTASKITSLDGMPAGDYYWVKYTFKATQSSSGDWHSQYPYVGVDIYMEDTFPEGCVVLDSSFSPLTLENGYYRADNFGSNYSSTRYNYLYVGYPKSIYNDANNNLTITNHVNLYVKQGNEEEYELADEDEITLNLLDFDFQYQGDLYGVSKTGSSDDGTFYSNFMLDEEFHHNCSYCYKGHADTRRTWFLSATAVYTGTPLTIRVGDDLMYISDANGQYRKMNDDEYHITSLTIPAFKNKNDLAISKDKYPTKIYVRYAGETEYTFYQTLTGSSSVSVSFENLDKKVVSFYLQIEDVLESLVFSSLNVNTEMHPQGDIAPNGRFYNFDYINVFSKAEDGTLTLLNNVALENYATLNTRETIASYDLATYGHYMQRKESYKDYKEYPIPNVTYSTAAYKTMTAPIQDAAREQFLITNTIGFYTIGDNEFCQVYTDDLYMQKLYFDYIDDIKLLDGYRCYDLLPKGMEIDSSPEEMLNTLKISNTTNYYDCYFYANGERVFNTAQEYLDFIKEHSTINIIENWKGTNRTKLEWIVDFSDTPLFFAYGNYSTTISYYPYIYLNYNSFVSYDSFLEFGKNYTNRNYVEMYQDGERKAGSNTTSDNGSSDPEASDINENGITNEGLCYASAQVNITSAVSTHQDVTTYVQTDQSNFSTGTVNSSCNSEYEYKLRVRTGSADVTNLIIYSNIEEAQPNRTRWKGDFIDIDTSYAESKGYVVKPYYSENPAAGNLYNNDGTLNSDWKEYIPDTQEIVANGLSITFDKNFATYNSSDYLYIYYNYDGNLYRSSSYYGATLAGQTIEIPSTDVYFYWYTSSSGNTAYGFKVNKIEPKVVTTTLGSSGYSLPTNTPIELTGSNYPETSHNPYNNNSRLLWHYIYTDNLVLQEHQEHIDKSKVKSLAFEYLDSEGNPAILLENSLTYVLINMKSPSDINIKELARMDCWTQWNAIDEFGQPVDFITGITSNVVKVALPNSVDEDSVPNISLRFIKEIQGTEDAFKNMNLNKADNQVFKIRLTSLTANDDGSYNQITALLKSNQELIISQIPIGTYLLEELEDNYFDFVEFTDNNDPEIVIEDVTFERTDQGYIITVSEELTETVEFNIKVTNQIEPKRFYEDKHSKENLFLKSKLESAEDDPA